jgi:hypothetical protein
MHGTSTPIRPPLWPGGGWHVETYCPDPCDTRSYATGAAAQHDRLIAEAVPRLAHCDIVMLAQFSRARARPGVQQMIGSKIMTSPDSAVAKLKAVLNGQQLAKD